MRNKKKLTEAETQVMKALWSLPEARGNSSEIMTLMPVPKPALTTLLTFLKILKEKGFVQSVKKGKYQEFSALVSREEYMNVFLRDVKNNFFSGSSLSLMSFFAKQENLSDKEIDELIDMIKNKKTSSETT